MLVTLTVNQAGTVFRTATRTAAAAATAAAGFGVPLFVAFACGIGAFTGAGRGLDIRRLGALSSRCLGAGDRGCSRGDGGCRSRNLHCRVDLLVRRLLAGITCLVAAVAPAPAATTTAVALTGFVGLLGAVVPGQCTTVVFTRGSRCTTVILIGPFTSLCTAFAAMFRPAATTLAIAATAFPAIASTALAFTAGRLLGDFGRLGCGLGFDLRSRAAAEPADQAFEQTRRGFSCSRGHNRLVRSLLSLPGRGGRDRRGLGGRNALDQCFGLCLDFLFFRRPAHVCRRRVDQIETGLDVFEARVVVTQALDVMVRRFQVTVRDEDQVDLQP